MARASLPNLAMSWKVPVKSLYVIAGEKEIDVSTVVTQPEVLAASARELQAITADMQAGNAAAAAPTTQITPAGADPVSLLTATTFAAHAELYQQVSAQATAMRQMLEMVLNISARSYDATEAANAAAVS